jgi:anti-sigma B factor antagonist
MNVNVQTLDGYTLIEASGDVDGATAPTLQEAVLAAAEPGCRLLLDMTQVTYMSSAGLRVMLLLHRQVSSGKGKVILVGLSEDLKDTMSATGFLKFFMLADDVAGGAAALDA